MVKKFALLLSWLFTALPLMAEGGKAAKIAISVWIGWMPFWVMQNEKFIDKQCAALGVPTAEFQVMGYTESLTAYQSGSVDGVVATLMDSARPAANNIPTTVVLINDFSNGGDGVLFRKGLDIATTKQKKIPVQLEEYSVSHFLFLRYLESLGGTYQESDFAIQNISADNAGKAFLMDESVQAVVTWNPHLFQAQETGKADLKFSSKDIPGEIADFLIFKSDFVKNNPKTVQAVVNAWYDVMAMLKDPAGRARAIEQMAKEAGSTAKEFERMMEDVQLFDTPEKCVAFLEGADVKNTEARVLEFLLKNKQIEKKAPLTYNVDFAKSCLKK